MSSVNLSQSRDRKSENFPVGSFLISSKLREIVHFYYNFARFSDDIADDAACSALERKKQLLAMKEALNTGKFSCEKEETAADLGRALAKRDIPLAVAEDLLTAFIQDTEQSRYKDWDDLMGYCAYSAAPVGRFLLAIHKEKKKAYEASDALCASLQVLNHLQDVQKDLKELDRCYLPQDWLAAEGVQTEDLLQSNASEGLRRVFDRILDQIDLLNQTASELPENISDRRLRMEAAVIVRLAYALAEKLREEDPLAQRVSLKLFDNAKAFLKGVLESFPGSSAQKREEQDGLPCAYQDMEWVERKIIAAKTSFYKGMKILSRSRREAMYALYALCRELDDIADGDSEAGNNLEKSNALLDHWSDAIRGIYQGNVKTPLERVLMAAVQRYHLEKEDFLEIIEGMRMDLKGPLVFPNEETLDLYCDRVASAVGRLSVKIFGADGKDGLNVAYHLGRALQQVNILRDIETDLKLDRCYLPKELADRFGISQNLKNLLTSEKLPDICEILALRAKDSFRKAEYYMRLCPPGTMRPARLMAASYKATLKSLERRGWKNLSKKPEKSCFWKLVYLLQAVIEK